MTPETETPQPKQPENHIHRARKKISKRELIRQRSIYALPNSVTLAALFAAFFAITQSMHGRYESLADMVSFGVAPALIVYNWQLYEFGKLGYCVAFIYCACAALRLALFNTLIGRVSKKWFIGIPSPTAAALMVGMIWVDRSYDGVFDQSSIWVLLMTLFAGLSMVVQIPFWSFKEIKLRHRISFARMIGMMMLIVLLVLQPALILFLAFFAYSLSGYVMWAWKKMSGRTTRLD